MQNPDLAQVRPPNDGGAINLIGLKYQYHFAASKCLDMLLYPDAIEFVASELQDDVAVKYRNGKYEFYQVKEKRNELWTISDLDSAGVWSRFLVLKRDFNNSEFYFVSDQGARYRVNNKPDLGRMRYLTTTTGREHCNQVELDEADDLTMRLGAMIDCADRVEAESIFWSIRVHTEHERARGLIAMNLDKLEEVLTTWGIESDQMHRERIYRSIISALEAVVAEPPPHANLRERLEMRKIESCDLQNCIMPPLKDAQVNGFEFNQDPSIAPFAKNRRQ